MDAKQVIQNFADRAHVNYDEALKILDDFSKKQMEARVEHILNEQMLNDNSFNEKETTLSLLFGGKKYTKSEAKEIWKQGIRYGIEIGLNKSSIRGQRIELNTNTTDPKHREFITKFYELSDQYNCAIQYHPEVGMTIIEKNYD